MTTEHELPPLPPGYKSYEFPDGGYDADEMQAYARRAIEADRKRRGEMVAWRYLTPTGWHATTDAAQALRIAEHHTVEPLYADPQPAAPAQVPSDDIDIDDVHQYLEAWGCLAHPGVRALIDRYGQPVEPEGWRLVPKELIDFLDAKEHHLPVEDRHVLSIMLEAAPKFGEEE